MKVTMSSEAALALKEMLEILKTENVGLSITPSDLATWIVKRFRVSHFEKSKTAIVSEHFNPKAFLRSRLKGVQSKVEISAVMNELKARMGKTCKRLATPSGDMTPESSRGKKSASIYKTTT